MSTIIQDYEQTTSWMFSRLPMFERIGLAAYTAKLDPTIRLMNYLGDPQNTFKTIHTAGTNGKGSTSHLLASVLMEAGYKVGLFTSPHLVDFRERITVNGQMISEDSVTEFVNRHKLYFDTHSLSFFEMTTAMAFDYFREQNVDVAVIETGLGGRLDSTNIITPVLSIITNIAIDHSSILGKSRRDIALEKAGIIKSAVPCLIGETDPEIQYIFEKKAAAEHSALHFTRQIDDVSAYNCPLGGDYQRFNISTVLTAFDLLAEEFLLNDSHLSKGIENVVQNTNLRGRWQILSQKPFVICDTGHNANGIAEIAHQLQKLDKKHLHIVLGMAEDKDTHSILGLLPREANYYFVQASTPRAMDSLDLKTRAKKFSLLGENFGDCVSGLNVALAQAEVDDCVFVGGSTFVVGDILAANLF